MLKNHFLGCSVDEGIQGLVLFVYWCFFHAGLMKVTLEDTGLHTVYLSDDCGGSGQRLAYLLKRLLLSHSNSDGAAIQTAAVQCIVLLLRGPFASSFSITILKADIAGATTPCLRKKQLKLFLL